MGRRRWWALPVCAILFLTLLGTEFREYRRERLDLESRIRLGDGSADVNASLTFLTFDSASGELVVRVDLAPSQAGVEVITSTSRGTVVQRFEKGAGSPTFEARVPATGYPADYPFDEYQGQFQLECRSLPDGRRLSTGFEVTSRLPTLNERVEGSKEPAGIRFHLSRNRLVKAFSVFINSMMLLIGLAILGITSAVAFFGRKVEVNKFGFMAGMLFAFPVVRNLQPEVPPLGIALDYFATFWAQGMAGLGLLVCACIWIFRQR